MSQPNYVAKVTLEIELGNGDFHKYVVDRPGVFGANPRYMAQQLETAIEELGRRGDDMLGTYAAQIGEPCSRPPGVVDDPCTHCGQPKAAHTQAWSA